MIHLFGGWQHTPGERMVVERADIGGSETDPSKGV